MSTINRLSSVDALQPGDLIPVWDGSNGDTRKASLTTLLAFIESNFADPDYSTRIVAPAASGWNVDVGDTGTSSWLVINPVADYALGSISLPSSTFAVNGQEIIVVCTQSVTAFSVTSSGATVSGTPLGLAAYSSFRMRYNTAQTTWYTLDNDLSPAFASLVSYTPAGTGAVATTVQDKLRESVSVKDFGAVGDGVADDTAAIQAAIYATTPSVAVNGYGSLYVPSGTYRVTDTLQMGNGTIKIFGDPQGSTILYDKPSAFGPVINLSTFSSGYGTVFEDLIIDTNQKATYGFYFASVGVFQAIKNMQFRNVYVTGLTSGSVGWQLGDQTNTGLDTDAWNWNFYSSHARGYAGSIGWVIDANNAYNIGWYQCSAGRSGVGNEILSWIKTIRGSGYRIYNFFGDLLQSTGTPWGIDHGGGSLSIFGLSSEDHRILKARSAGQADSMVYMVDISSNDDTTPGGVTIDSQVNTEVRNAVLGNTTYPREIICSGDFTGNNVAIGGTGKYTLSTPRRNVLEGTQLGTWQSPLGNSLFELWRGQATNDAPLGWAINPDGGGLTISGVTAFAVTGKYSVDIVVSTAATAGVANRVAGVAMLDTLDVSPYRGSRISFYAIGHRQAAEQVQIDFKVDGALTGVIGGANSINETAGSGLFFCYGYADIGLSALSATFKVGLQVGTTGRIWLDSVGVFPADWSGFVPALYEIAKQPNWEVQQDILRTGYVPLGRSGSNIQANDSAAPTTGTWARGDRVYNVTPTVGSPKGWRCTVAGSPGTWVSEGNL
jgi:hypothetical protein